MEVSDLKLTILQQLLAHPTLAREFNQDVIDEHLHGADRLDREIAEVWRASTATTAAEAAVLSHGALLEMLADSEHAEEYRALAAQEMEVDTGVEMAREIVSEGFAKLRLRRLSANVPSAWPTTKGTPRHSDWMRIGPPITPIREARGPANPSDRAQMTSFAWQAYTIKLNFFRKRCSNHAKFSGFAVTSPGLDGGDELERPGDHE